MYSITISGKTTEELSANAAAMIALLGGTSAKAVTVLSASDQARLRGDATVVPPSNKADTKPLTAAEKKAAKKAAEEAAAAAEADDSTDESDSAEDDVLGEAEGNEDEAVTQDDVKKLLIEVRGAYPKDTTIVSKIVKEHGKAAKLSDVEDKQLPKVAAHCRELLKKAAK